MDIDQMEDMVRNLGCAEAETIVAALGVASFEGQLSDDKHAAALRWLWTVAATDTPGGDDDDMSQG